jgi:tetratricopeptide repeat protein
MISRHRREITLRLGEGSRTRRSRTALEAAVDQATSARKKAIALYQLGLFHDNNARESVAIPLYERALRAGLENALKAQALAWLASSLYKTGGLRRALSVSSARDREGSQAAEISARPRDTHQSFARPLLSSPNFVTQNHLILRVALV